MSIFPDRFFPDYCLGWLVPIIKSDYFLFDMTDIQLFDIIDIQVATTPNTAEALLTQVGSKFHTQLESGHFLAEPVFLTLKTMMTLVTLMTLMTLGAL